MWELGRTLDFVIISLTPTLVADLMDSWIQVEQRISARMAHCEVKAANQISLFPEEMKETPFEDGGFFTNCNVLHCQAPAERARIW
jgi:hypothetical protein